MRASREHTALLIWLPVAVLLVAAALRLWCLASLPYGLARDESYNVLDEATISWQYHPVFFPANGGREALFFYWQGLFLALLGRTTFAVRLPAAFVGTATVALQFAVVRRTFGYRVAILASATLATVYWAVQDSRVGLRHTTVPLFVLLTIWALHRAAHRRRLRDFALAGAVVGLAAFSYTAADVLPAVAVAYALFLMLTRREKTRAWLAGGGVASLSCAIVAAPLALHLWAHRGEMQRVPQTAAVHLGQPAPEVLGVLGRQALTYLASLTGHGDTEWIFNLSGRAVFDPLMGALAYAGLALLVVLCVRPGIGPWRFAERDGALLFLCSLLALAVPGLITHPAPYYSRVVGVLPALALAPALALDAMRAAIGRVVGGACRGKSTSSPPLGARYALPREPACPPPRADQAGETPALPGKGLPSPAGFPIRAASAWLPVAIVAVPLVVQGAGTAHDYFVRWARAPSSAYAYSSGAVAIAAYLRSAHLRGEVDVSTDDPHVVRALAPVESAAVRWFHADQFVPLPVGHTDRFYLSDGDTSSPLDQMLAAHGTKLVDLRDPNAGVVVAHGYRLPASAEVWTPPAASPAASFGGVLDVTGSEVRRDPADPATYLVILGLRARRDGPGYLGISARAVDEAGDTWAQEDGSPEDIGSWKAGEAGILLHRLRLPAGTPPGTLRAVARVYQITTLEPLRRDDGKGDALDLGTVTNDAIVPYGVDHRFPPLTPLRAFGALCPPESVDACREAGRHPATLAGPAESTPRLEGYRLGAARARQGQVATLDLLWTCPEHPSAGSFLTVSVVDGSGAARGQMLAGSGPKAPELGACTPGATVLDRRTVQVGPRWPPGSYTIEAAVSGPAGGQIPIRIATLGVDELERTTRLPAVQRRIDAQFEDGIALAGINQKAQEDGSTVDVALVWRATGEPARGYTAFVHLLGEDGHLIAQHDGPPSGGAWPSSWWEAGQVVIDDHAIPLPPGGMPAGSRWEIGLYDPETGHRLRPLRASLGTIEDDAVVFPTDS